MAAKRKHQPENTENDNKKPKTSTGHWSLGLLQSMNDPELQVKSDDLIVIIKDKYAKAKFHYLVMPKADVSNLKQLKQEHVKLLKHMEKAATDLVSDKKHKKSVFKFGYHAEASMHRLHMHIISDDMDSPCVKTKKHWNSFTTDFFLDAKAVHEDLEKNGKITLPSKEKIREYINAPLSCHKCDTKPKNMPTLKTHILSHLK